MVFLPTTLEISKELSIHRLIFPFPNTYVLTKNLAEHVCMDYHHLPIVIYRASIVTNAETEPEPGDMGSVNGVLAFMVSDINCKYLIQCCI